MTPRTSMIKVMTCHDFVLDSLVIVLEAVLCIVTLEHKKVLYLKLLIFAPPDSQAILLARHPATFLYFGGV